MAALESSSNPAHLSLTSIPDLTDKVARPDNQYCAAGGFGDVFRCECASEDGVKEVAVKSFRFNFSVDEGEYDAERAARAIRRELGIWRHLDHRNIVPFLGIVYGFGRQGNASLVSLWMPHGTLHAYLKAHDNELVVSHRLQLLLDIANGLHYLHSFPVVHGDLTSNNVLIDHNHTARLTDFGCASLIGNLPEGFTYLKASCMKLGTLRWAAPEHFSLEQEDTKHTIKSDIYSFGNMALLVLSGKYPWSEVQMDAAVVLRLCKGYTPSRPLSRHIDDQHWALIKRCWSSIPERPLAEDIVSTLQEHLSVARAPDMIELATVGCTKPSFKLCVYCNARPQFSDGKTTFPFCSKTCAQNAGATGIVGAGAAEAPSRPLKNGCLLCGKAVKKGNFCSQACTSKVDKNAPQLLEVPSGHDTFENVVYCFVASWRHLKPCPTVRQVYKVIGRPALIAKYEAYRASVEARGKFAATGRSPGNQVRRWHGTTRECLLGDNGNTALCSSTSCSLCGIIRTSYGLNLFGKKTGWGRFGAGICTSSTSSKSNDYSSNVKPSMQKAILLNQVVVGKGYKMTQNNPMLTAPPPGYDSVLGEVPVRGSLNYDELICYTENAIRPSYLVIYDA